MRKLLLATTALFGGVAFAGAAHAMPAQSSPITLNVGGYVDFVAGFFHEADGLTPTDSHASKDFETEFKINFDAMGKAANGIQYGANVSLWNGSDVTNQAATGSATLTATPYAGAQSSVNIDSAYVWMSGAFGKLMLGDEHGASDLFVYAPTVGEGQVDGRYMDFVDPTRLARMQPSGIDNTEHSTKVTYYTPKVGNDMNKVQLGLSYTPNLYNYGQSAVLYNQNLASLQSQVNSPYQDVVEGDLAYTGNFHPVNVAVSGQILTGDASHAVGTGTLLMLNAPTAWDSGEAQDFTAWGVGTQVGFNGLTFGGSYVDEGRYDTTHGQNKAQDITTLGVKYEFDKVGVAASWLTGQGYDNMLANGGGANTLAGTNYTNYVRSFDAEGLGATYTWFPGLTSNIDGVLFQQKENTFGGTAPDENQGYVLLLSQKMTF
jgi:hypothetical protein